MQVWKKPDFLSSKKQMSWQDLTDYEETHEIFTEYPYAIRKKSNGKILKETLNGKGYYQVKMNGISQKKHRLIAKHFIPNPDNFPFVDHKNGDTTDNHVSNLRWVTHAMNQQNRKSTQNVEYEFIKYGDEPEDLIQVTDYGNHEFEDYYYSPSQNLFYFDNGVKFRELHINYTTQGYAYIYAMNTSNKRIQIYYNKFKKLYNLQ